MVAHAKIYIYIYIQSIQYNIQRYICSSGFVATYLFWLVSYKYDELGCECGCLLLCRGGSGGLVVFDVAYEYRFIVYIFVILYFKENLMFSFAKCCIYIYIDFISLSLSLYIYTDIYTYDMDITETYTSHGQLMRSMEIRCGLACI